MNNITKVILDNDKWEAHFKGYNIVDCAIWTNNKIILIAKENVPGDEYDVLREGSITTRIISITASADTTKCGHIKLSGFRFPKVTIERKKNSIVLVSSRESEGCIFQVNLEGVNGLEYITPEGDKDYAKSSSPRKLKTINGTVYSVGIGRRIYKRVSAGHWEPMNEGLTRPEHMSSADMGFEDIHGPNEQHLYAVGGCGDVWHYDGKKWQWCDFPTNEQLSAVVVAPNGDVYVSSEGGSLWRGKMHTWERIYTGGSSVLNKDLIWFNDQLWVSSDYQVRIWNGQTLERPLYDGKEMILAGNMDAYENLLLVADINTVNIFDGKDWHNIVTPY